MLVAAINSSAGSLSKSSGRCSGDVGVDLPDAQSAHEPGYLVIRQVKLNATTFVKHCDLP